MLYMIIYKINFENYVIFDNEAFIFRNPKLFSQI